MGDMPGRISPHIKTPSIRSGTAFAVDTAALIEIGISLAMLVLGAVFVWRQWRARSLARSQRAIEATVASVQREESGSRMYAWFVDTVYDVPGHGLLHHRRGFETEEQAILWSRLHKEGSKHPVIPNAVETDKVFLREDLESTAWHWIAIIVFIAAVLAYSIYAVIVR